MVESSPLKGLAACAALTVMLWGAAAQAAEPSSAGANIFAERCAPCHQADGSGAPGVIPPLANTLGGYLKTEAGRKFLSQILITGMNGPIDSQGKKYNGVMPPFAFFKDGEIAAILGHVLTKLNGQKSSAATPFPTVESIAAARAAGGSPGSARELRQQARSGK